MIALARSHWKVASTFVALGLVGSCATAFALAGAPPRTAARRPGPSLRAQRSSQPQTASALLGRRLLDEAAAACQRVPYRGQQRVVWHGRDSSTAALVQVWHRGGSPTLTSSPDTEVATPGGGQQPPVYEPFDQGGILWVSSRLVKLMLANYQIVAAGRGTVGSRPALIVELRRPDGSLAARFWLDAGTKLPLRRDTFDTDSRPLSMARFTTLDIGHGYVRAIPAPAGQAGGPQLSRAALAGLRASGWPLPRRLGGTLVLYAAARTWTRSGEVVDLAYSDGLSVVSVFVQRGELAGSLPGWHRVTAAGHEVFAVDPDGRNLSWSAHGFVYTVIADAPPATVGQVVATLPHGTGPGFWARMARGFRRLVSWANPFG